MSSCLTHLVNRLLIIFVFQIVQELLVLQLQDDVPIRRRGSSCTQETMLAVALWLSRTSTLISFPTTSTRLTMTYFKDTGTPPIIQPPVVLLKTWKLVTIFSELPVAIPFQVY